MKPKGFATLTMHRPSNVDVPAVLAGLQEETTVLRVPCITMHNNIERPITCEVGTNLLVGNEPAQVLARAKGILNGEVPQGRVPELWDGKAAERIVEVLMERFLGR